LDQVRQLLRLADDQPCTEVGRIARQHLVEVERKLADLSALARVAGCLAPTWLRPVRL
jgi:hypothetical protein